MGFIQSIPFPSFGMIVGTSDGTKPFLGSRYNQINLQRENL